MCIRDSQRAVGFYDNIFFFAVCPGLFLQTAWVTLYLIDHWGDLAYFEDLIDVMEMCIRDRNRTTKSGLPTCFPSFALI